MEHHDSDNAQGEEAAEHHDSAVAQVQREINELRFELQSRRLAQPIRAAKQHRLDWLQGKTLLIFFTN